jgi:endonuclease YncB( thermonuclease family)
MPQGIHSGKLPWRASSWVFPLSGMRELCEHRAMLVSLRPSRYWHARSASIVLSGALVAAPFVAPALAAGCSFAPQGEGRVAAVTNARGFRLEDGREVRLAGIEPVSSATTRKDRTAALAALIAGHDVTLRGQDDAPDRYGRQVAFVYLAGTETLVQAELLRQGEALGSADAADKDCAMTPPPPRPTRGRPNGEPGPMPWS